MAGVSEIERDALGQLDELSEMAFRGRASIVSTGPIMIIWGVAIMIAALCEVVLNGSVYAVAAWVMPVIFAYIVSLFSIRLSQSDGRAVTWRSRAVHRIWVAAGAAIVVFNLGEELHRSGLQSESEAATALILAVATLATGEVIDRQTLVIIGISWMAVASGLFYTAGSTTILILALASAILQIAPGLILLREEWKA